MSSFYTKSMCFTRLFTESSSIFQGLNTNRAGPGGAAGKSASLEKEERDIGLSQRQGKSIQQQPLSDDTDTKQDQAYLNGIINDRGNSNTEYVNIHRCAFMLWIATIKAKKYEYPRKIARRVIDNFHFGAYSNQLMSFNDDDNKELNKELTSWLDGWSYGNGKTFHVKVLLLNLLLTKREPLSKGYMQPNVIIELNNPLNYKLDAGKLQLDHLEAENPTVISSKYYKFDKLEERKKDVNGYLGNFMVLDAEENNRKKNLPLYDAMSFYSGIKTAWLVDDIAEMIVDNNYSELTDHVPKEDFFTVRSRQLKKYFSEFLNRKFGDTSITVNL